MAHIEKSDMSAVIEKIMAPTIAKMHAQTEANLALAKQATLDAIAAIEASEDLRKQVAADINALRADIHAELDQFQPTQGGFAYIKRA